MLFLCGHGRYSSPERSGSPSPTPENSDMTTRLSVHHHRPISAATLALMMCWAVSGSLAFAQNGGTVRGVLRAPDETPVARAPVELRNPMTGAVIRTKTSSAGEFRFESVANGTYTLVVPPDGFTLAAFERPAIQVQSGQSVQVNVRLEWGGNLGTVGDDQSRFYLALPDPPSGPAPRTMGGKPDFAGVWIGTAFENVRDTNGEPERPLVLPWAEPLVKERIGNSAKDHPSGFCLPSFAFPGGSLIFKIVQSESALVTLFETMPTYRQVFLDGRAHPNNPNPSWMGHSVGRWDGDTLVIDSVGFNDKSWIEIFPHREDLHVVERYTRADQGHLHIEVTVEDPKTFTRPWRTVATWTLAPGQEVLEYICAENNKLPQRVAGP